MTGAAIASLLWLEGCFLGIFLGIAAVRHGDFAGALETGQQIRSSFYEMPMWWVTVVLVTLVLLLAALPIAALLNRFAPALVVHLPLAAVVAACLGLGVALLLGRLSALRAEPVVLWTAFAAVAAAAFLAALPWSLLARELRRRRSASSPSENLAEVF